MRSVCALLALMLPGLCSAGIVVSSVTASSTFRTYDANNLINGSGLSGGLHDEDYEHMWASDGTPTGSLVFDLGGVYSLTDALVWNYNAECCGLERGVRDLTVSISGDGVSYTPIGDFGLTEGTGGWIPADVLNLGGATGRFVQFGLTRNYGDEYLIGLSEVQFDGASVSETPEPGTAMLFLAAAALFILVMPLTRKGKPALHKPE
jgi:hypothetical protein